MLDLIRQAFIVSKPCTKPRKDDLRVAEEMEKLARTRAWTSVGSVVSAANDLLDHVKKENKS
jgi:hypothetical protein